MIYIIEGNEPFFIARKIKEITSAENADISSFDGSQKDFSVTEIVNACTAVSLFADKTIVLVKNPAFLIKKEEGKDLNALLSYCENPLYENDLVLYTYDDNFNSRLNAYKSISANADNLKLDKIAEKEFPRFCYSEINNAKIKMDRHVAEELIIKCNNDVSLFFQNLELLKIYPDTITSDVVLKLCTSSDEYQVFDFINALTNKKMSAAFRLEKLILEKEGSVSGIIALLAGQLRFLYYVAYLNSKGTSIDEMMSLTGSRFPKRINKALETLQNLNMNSIMKLLSSLSDLDYLIKSDNSIPENVRFDYFILEMTK